MPGTYSRLSGDMDRIHSVEFVDQNPIGKSTRSNPATYLKAFDEIRKLFAEQQGAKQMGFSPSYFSFNSEGGRCEECKGEGTITVEMQFMADIVLECESCHGKRYKQDVLDIEYRGKNISDVLDMTINQAIEFFSEVNGSQEKRIIKRLKPLQDVGLGYIKLGQSSSTLSGGENQRVKLAFYLSQEKADPSEPVFGAANPPTAKITADAGYTPCVVFTSKTFSDFCSAVTSQSQTMETPSCCAVKRMASNTLVA